MLEVGHSEPAGELLFDRTAFKAALPEVSKVRLEQTLFAEHPALRPYLEKLEGEKTQQYPATLAEIWDVDVDEAQRLGDSLVEVGFFERRGSRDEPAYWVPHLYRDALQMVRGSADPARDADPEEEDEADAATAAPLP
jgi:hypothetical protein